MSQDISVAPIGDPSTQCWVFTIKDERIKSENGAGISGGSDCVYLQSAAVADGEAVFVVCCKKNKDGKCVDCENCEISLDISGCSDASRTVRISCRPGQ